ncbi:MAG: SpoIID/LytB domain-containing protein [Acidimicrobiales bacterium]
MIVITASTVLPISVGPAAAADDRPVVVIEGRGWGHGRGMGQYGALGYATNAGWTSGQILDHYYGGTTAGPAPIPGLVDPRQVRVDLVYMKGRSTTVSLDDGTLHLMASDGSTIRRATGAIRLTVSGSSMAVETAPGCSGPWAAEAAIDRSLIRIEAETGSDGQAGLLQACGPSYRTWYDGELWATNSAGRQHTINVVSVEDYLRGVVPNEVPAGWHSAALEAQAVAARSYVLAGDTRWTGYADTCDTTTCQVYDGRFTTRGAGLRTSTHSRTDEAIAATSSVVRLSGAGTVARTEFSSSTGGYTAGGDFPAVPDEGDSVVANGNARWRVTVDLRAVENSYGKGPITGLSVVERTGLGADGGRAVSVEYRFAGGTVTVDGDRVRRQLGLKSNWFSFGPLTRGDVVIDEGDSEIARFVKQAYERLQGRPPTDAEAQRWQQDVRDGSRLSLTEQLVHSEYFAGVLIDDLYLASLGRPADPDGRLYWIGTMSGGLKYENLGTLFYGSPEYVKRSGDTNQSFVASLYRNILGRDPDPDGNAYWLGLLDGGQAAPADVANAFYRSVESRRDRSHSVYRRVMDGEPSADAVAAGADRLLAVDDLTLAAELAVTLGTTESNTG